MRNSHASLSILVAVCIMLFSSSGAAWAADFTLTSTTIKDGGTLPDKQLLNGFGCTGANISPELQWFDAPRGTKGFALTAYDPDAPTGSGWWHWVVYNIPASVHALPEGAGNPNGTMPAGTVQGRTDFGSPGYGGACPPQNHGPHRYIFTIFALDVAKLDVPDGCSAAMIGFYLNNHTLKKASLTATYER